MNLKMKLIAAAIAAMGTSVVFAAPLDPKTTTPDVTFYISGASAQKNAVAIVVPKDLFDVPNDVVKISGVNGSTGWLGQSSLAGGKLLVLYNSTNGSAAGINQLLSTASTPTEAESKNIKLPDTSCSAVSGTSGAFVSTGCTSSVATETDIALSDVKITEFASGVLGSGAGYLSISATSGAGTGLEGFGVIVNSKMYSALQNQNVVDGFLPASCATTYPGIVKGGLCQPSIRRSDYATIATFGGAFTGSETLALVPDVAAAAAEQTTLCRRDDLSGTQAASNIFFLNSICGTAGFGGNLIPATDSTTSTLKVVAAANNGTGVAESCTAGATGLALGVVSLGELDEADVNYNGSKGFYYAKIDNVSPNYDPSLALNATNNTGLDAVHRKAMRNANFTFATDMTANWRNTIAAPKSTLKDAFVTGLKDSTLHDLVGIGYLDQPLNWPTGDAKNVKFDRAGNNCAPLH